MRPHLYVRPFLRTSLLVLALSAVSVAPAGARVPVESTDNVTLLGSSSYDGGSELAAHGRYVYAGEMDAVGGGQRGSKPQDGGLHVFDTKKMRRVAFLHCPGNDNEVELIRPGVVGMAFGTNRCAPGVRNGIMLIDVSDPSRPTILSTFETGSAHTMKPHPGGRYLYMAGDNQSGSADPGTVIVDVADPRKPEVAATATQVMDCHDVSFSAARKGRLLGFCAGAVGTGEVQIWDVTDPLAPAVLGRIVNPLIQFSHYAVANHDGTVLAIDDEAFAAHDCNTGASPTGRLWLYDITNPELPMLKGSVAPPRGGDGTTNLGTYQGWVPSWCTSHGIDWHPTKDLVAVTWFTGGFSVLDTSDPAAPTEEAWFQADNSATYSVLWHDGMLLTNDHVRGLDVFTVDGT